MNTQAFGISTQARDYQRAFVYRMRIPFELLSDADPPVTEALRLPTFLFDEMRLIKRLSLVAENARIIEVLYPVFPPNKSAQEVLASLSRSGVESPTSVFTKAQLHDY